MTVHARQLDGVITLEAGHRDTHLAKQVPGARYHARPDAHHTAPHFVYPLSWGTCKALRGVFRDALEIGPSLASWAREEYAKRVEPAMAIRASSFDTVFSGYDAALRPYQTQAVEFLVWAKHAILADEMRLGKTPESLVAAKTVGGLPALIVTPNSVKFQWEEAVHTWWPEARPVIVRGSAGQRRATLETIAAGEADVAIINWEALRLHSRVAGYGSVVAIARCEQHGGDGRVTPAKCEAHPRELNEIPWRVVIADEAHKAAHPRAKQTRALWAVAADAEYRWALTGTPVLNTPEDLWSLGHWIAPEDFPGKTSFIERYGLVGWNPFGGLEVMGLREDTKAELFSFLDPRFMRRTREMVMQWLPEKIYTERTVEMGTKQAKAYKEMATEMLTELETGTTYVTNSLAKLTRLRQFASAYAVLEPVTESAEVDADPEAATRTRLRLSSPSCKVDALVEIAEELGGDSAVVFAELKQLVNMAGAALVKAGYDVGYVTGDVKDDERNEQVRDFQRGDLQFLMVTLGAGGEGLTLDRADIAIFLQRSFSLAKNRQAEDRIVGQHAGPGLQIIDVVTANSIEARVKEVLADKERITEEIVRDRDTMRRLLT